MYLFWHMSDSKVSFSVHAMPEPTAFCTGIGAQWLPHQIWKGSEWSEIAASETQAAGRWSTFPNFAASRRYVTYYCAHMCRSYCPILMLPTEMLVGWVLLLRQQVLLKLSACFDILLVSFSFVYLLKYPWSGHCGDHFTQFSTNDSVPSELFAQLNRFSIDPCSYDKCCYAFS